jgi:hypothetical protein
VLRTIGDGGGGADGPGVDVKRYEGPGVWRKRDGEDGGGVYRHGCDPLETVGVWTFHVWMLGGMGEPGVWRTRDGEDDTGVTYRHG